MRPVSYARAADIPGAIAAVSADPDSAFLAGGTTEVDLLRLGVVQPDRLVDINALPLSRIEDLPDGGLRIGALARMSDAAEAPGVGPAVPGDRAGAGAWRLGAVAPHGLDGRQPAATDPLQPLP